MQWPSFCDPGLVSCDGQRRLRRNLQTILNAHASVQQNIRIERHMKNQKPMSLLSLSNARDTQLSWGEEAEESVPFAWFSDGAEARLSVDAASMVEDLRGGS